MFHDLTNPTSSTTRFCQRVSVAIFGKLGSGKMERQSNVDQNYQIFNLDQSKTPLDYMREWMVQGTTPMCGAGDPWQPNRKPKLAERSNCHGEKRVLQND